MKKLISFCLWGDDPKYCVGAVKNAMLRKEIYPDWVSRFYVHKDVPQEYVEKLKSIEGTEVVILDSAPGWSFTLERFKAIDDPEVERAIFRDTDSRLNEREKAAVEDWEKSKTILHIMKDHPYHGGFPILAGMWGLYKRENLGSIEEAIESYKRLKPDVSYHYDQIFLAMVYESLKTDVTIHDEFFLKRPFPTARNGSQFVGQVFDENDNTEQAHIDALNQ